MMVIAVFVENNIEIFLSRKMRSQLPLLYAELISHYFSEKLNIYSIFSFHDFTIFIFSNWFCIFLSRLLLFCILRLYSIIRITSIFTNYLRDQCFYTVYVCFPGGSIEGISDFGRSSKLSPVRASRKTATTWGVWEFSFANEMRLAQTVSHFACEYRYRSLSRQGLRRQHSHWHSQGHRLSNGIFLHFLYFIFHFQFFIVVLDIICIHFSILFSFYTPRGRERLLLHRCNLFTKIPDCFI